MILEKARAADAEEIYLLINKYAQEGLLLPKTLSFIYENLRQYIVAKENGRLIGVGGLRLFGPDLAEICSLAVEEGGRRRGVGRAIVAALEEDARFLGIHRVFALTYQTVFFDKVGYHVLDRHLLPQKIWKDCLGCPKNANCDETACIKEL
ncbi:MAG: N-acetyltransferase [Clostridiales bacterium]|nr:N-acetyltransferase [Clostridiales bacterium]